MFPTSRAADLSGVPATGCAGKTGRTSCSPAGARRYAEYTAEKTGRAGKASLKTAIVAHIPLSKDFELTGTHDIPAFQLPHGLVEKLPCYQLLSCERAQKKRRPFSERRLARGDGSNAVRDIVLDTFPVFFAS